MATDPSVPFQYLPSGNAAAPRTQANFEAILKYIRDRNDGTVAWDSLVVTGGSTFNTAITITPTTNQIILGTTRTVTLTAPTPASASRIITFPDLSGAYSVVGTIGAQTVAGVKTFSNDVVLSADIYTTGWTDYSGTTSLTGFSATSTLKVFYKKLGKLVFLFWDITGTSNSALFSFTLPVTRSTDAGFNITGPIGAVNNTAALAGGIYQIASAGTSITFFTSGTGGSWVASGVKASYGQCTYQSA